MVLTVSLGRVDQALWHTAYGMSHRTHGATRELEALGGATTRSPDTCTGTFDIDGPLVLVANAECPFF